MPHKPKSVTFFNNPVIKNLIKLYRPIASLNYFNYLAGWDTETFMPSRGITGRGRALADLSLELQAKYLDPEFLKTLELAATQQDLTDQERAVVRVLELMTEQYTKLPKAFIEEFSELTAKTSTIWAEARKKDEPELFLPWLEKIFELTRKKAELLGFAKDPYDAIFRQYEMDLNTEEIDAYFSEIKEFLGLLDLNSAKFPKSDLYTSLPYDKGRMQELNLKVLMLLGFDPTRMRLDISSHPFSLFLTPEDIRLTTRYPDKDFTSSLLPSIHEFGHGLYSSQVDSILYNTPLWPETSYALHESQSRFWENMLGRSRGFISTFMEDIRDVHDIKLSKKLTPQATWDYLNQVEPGLIRVNADEVTYHWHIIIRYEIEREVLLGRIKVREIPELWNCKYKEYLGITPRTAAEGFLQDIHWSFGSVGYFPTYSLGSATSALWLELLEKDKVIDLAAEFDTEAIFKLNAWFREKVHQYAGTYTLKEMWDKAAGQKFSARPWIKYIKNKYKIT